MNVLRSAQTLRKPEWELQDVIGGGISLKAVEMTDGVDGVKGEDPVDSCCSTWEEGGGGGS